MADTSTLSYKPQVLVDTADLPEKDWLEYRRRGIGGSDAASILGVSPFKTARDLYYDKLKIVTYEDPEENWVQKKMGHLLEDLVAEIFHVRTGYEIYQVKKMFYHPKYPFGNRFVSNVQHIGKLFLSHTFFSAESADDLSH